MSGINAPDPTEHFLLADGEKKVVVEADSRSKNTVILTLNKEDHTIGNLLRTKLLTDDRTIFAGYRMPHPLINHALVRIRAVEGTAPLTLAVDATDALITEVNSVEAQFDAQIERIRQEQDQQHYQGYHQ